MAKITYTPPPSLQNDGNGIVIALTWMDGRRDLGQMMRKRVAGKTTERQHLSVNHSFVLSSILPFCLRRYETPVRAERTTCVAFNFHRHFVIGANERGREGGGEGGAISHFQWRVK